MSLFSSTLYSTILNTLSGNDVVLTWEVRDRIVGLARRFPDRTHNYSVARFGYLEYL